LVADYSGGTEGVKELFPDAIYARKSGLFDAACQA
jgi:hypothetical protein